MISYTIDPLIKSRKLEELLTDVPKVLTVNQFTEASAKEFRKEFYEAIQTKQPIVPVVIDSFGGQAYALTSMIDTISQSPVPVATVVTGKAMSCGAILFACGTDGYRVIGPMATLMIHEVSSMAFGKIEEIKADVAEAERLNQQVFRMMAKRCGKGDEYFLQIVHNRGHADWYLTPEECLKHNLANRIGSFQIKVDIKTTISF